jgi:predicted translin family RNA/ssDNA-binding protein
MQSDSEDKLKKDPAEASAHVANAHALLKSLQEKLGEHPELGAAITKLEMALNLLAVNTGGML